MNELAEKGRGRISLATQVFIGLGLGIATGVLLGEEAAMLKIVGDAFIALLQITVIPYVIVALVTSIGRLSIDAVISLSLKAGSILLVLWLIGISVVLAAPFAFPVWPSASFFSVSQINETEPVTFLDLYVPSNIFASLSNAVMPAIVVFSILFGLALTSVSEKHRIIDLLSTIGEVLIGITGFVGKLAPYGVYAITASAAGTIEVADLGRLQVYIVVYIVLSLILSLWLVPGLITAVTPLRYSLVMRTFRGPLVAAFATGNLLIVLPLLASDSKKLLALGNKQSNAPTEQEESSVDLLIPAAYPFPNLGSVFVLLFVLFGGWYTGSEVSVTDYLTLTVVGLASLFGGAVLTLPFLFDLLKLPADLFQVFITVDVIAVRFGTLMAAMHLIAIALIGTCALQGTISFNPLRLLRFSAISIALIAGALVIIRAFYTYVYVQPYEFDQILANLELIEDPQPHVVYRNAPIANVQETTEAQNSGFLKERGVLRACYVLDDYPSSYFNSKGELVGFDVEMMHRFAKALDASVQFVPVSSISDASERINSSYCDILASMIRISPRHAETFTMTLPVMNAPVGLIVSDYRRDEFRQWASILEKPDLRIALFKDPDTEAAVRRLLPNVETVNYNTKNELDALLAAGASNIDAVAGTAEEGAAWTIRYPEFNLVTPSPTLFVPLGFAVSKGDTELLAYLESWLLSAKANGTIDQLYRYWMLGEINKSRAPRWSVIRDVLGWIE